MRKMRVWMIVSPYYPPRLAGGAKFPITLTEELLIYDDIEIIHLTSNPGSWRVKTELKDGYIVHRLPAMSSSGFLKQIESYSFAVSSVLYLLVNRHKFDIIHVFGAFPYALGSMLLSYVLKKKAILRMTEAMSDDPSSILKRVLGKLQLKIFMLADKVISLSDELTKSYLDAGLPRSKLVEIMNGVNLEKFYPVSEAAKHTIRLQLNLDVSTPIVVFVGSIIRRKGVDLLIEIWNKLKQANNQNMPLLLLVGPTEMPFVSDNRIFVEGILDRINVLNLNENVRFVGKVENVEKFLQAADIFVFLSRSEGMPSALLEAMACGLPVVASEECGSRKIVQNGQSGFVIRNEDINTAAYQLQTLIESRETRETIGKAARNQVLKVGDLRDCCKKHRGLYQALLGINNNDVFN